MPIRTPWPTAKEVAEKVREDNRRLAEEAAKRRAKDRKATKVVRVACFVVFAVLIIVGYLATH